MDLLKAGVSQDGSELVDVWSKNGAAAVCAASLTVVRVARCHYCMCTSLYRGCLIHIIVFCFCFFPQPSFNQSG